MRKTEAVARVGTMIVHLEMACGHQQGHTCWCPLDQRVSAHKEMRKRVCDICWPTTVMHHEARIRHLCGHWESLTFFCTYVDIENGTGPVAEVMQRPCEACAQKPVIAFSFF